MAPTTKDTPLTAEEQKKWDDEVAMKMEALGNITCRERFDTFKYEENTKRHMPGEHKSVGEQVAKPALWGARTFANDGDPIPLGLGTRPRKRFDRNEPLPETHQTSGGLSPYSTTNNPSPNVALKKLPGLDPGKETKVEGKKPVEEEDEGVFVEVDLEENEGYEMVEKDEAEIAEWETI